MLELLLTIVILFTMLPNVMFPVSANDYAASGKCGENLTWVRKEDTITISGTGEMFNYDNSKDDNEENRISPWLIYMVGGTHRIDFLREWNEALEIYEDVRYDRFAVVIQPGVTSIGSEAFIGCDISELIIPDTVSSIDESAFNNASILSINVSENNPFFCCDENGVLCTKDMKRLIVAPATEGLSEIFIPETVTTIDKGAFSNLPESCKFRVSENNPVFSSNYTDALLSKDMHTLYAASCPTEKWAGYYKMFIVPDTVFEIADYAFENSSFEVVVLPKSIKSIGKSIGIHAFSNFQGVPLIVFCGDMPLISELTKADSYNYWIPQGDCFFWYPKGNETWNMPELIKKTHTRASQWTALDIPNFNGFWTQLGGWSFANAAQSFAKEPASHADDYFIPRERYDALFGSSYVDSTEGLYTEEWGGNCAGMSTTAILFFLDMLDWESIDADYSEDFSNPNDFYRTVNLHNRSQSYYPAIGNDTELTRLIEAYQLYINAIDKSRLVENLDNTYFEADVTVKNTLFGSEYIINHVSDGTYISTMLEEFQEAYNENNPLLIVLQADGFGHGIVARTDLKPEDMGDGWWRIYVYDPNKPYINESVTNIVSGVEAEPKYTFGCNTLVDNGGDIYLELNPSLNQWRYCTSVNSNSADSYIGSSPSGELLWKNYYHHTTPENENDDEGKKNNAKIPDYFYTIDLTDLSMEDFANPHFDSTNAWIPKNDLAIAVDGNTDCSIYASTGELAAIVEDGDAFILSDAGSYDAYIGQVEDGGSLGGKIYLPNDVYTVYYTSGAVQFLGSDNALSFSCEGAAKLTVDITLNSLQIVAQEDGIAAVKCANVNSTDECSFVATEGALVAGETFTIAYSDNNKVEASTDSKDGEFRLYQKDADQEEAVATKVIKSTSLWWLWIVGGVAVAGVVLFIIMKEKKPNA